MFAKFNIDKFPDIVVTLGDHIENLEDFTNFTKFWIKLYENKKYFNFTFCTKNVGYIHPKYALYMAFFIKNIKKREIQYLTNSTIYIYSNLVFSLLNIIFTIERPIAPVKLIYIFNNSTKVSIIMP